MVKIPDRPNGPLAGGRIDPHSVGNSSAIFRGIAQGADKVFQAALHMQETRDHDLLVEAQNAYTNAMTGWTTEAEQSRQGGSARGFTQDFTKQHEATAEDVLARMKQNGGSGNAEAAFQNWSASRQSVGLAGAAQFEHRQMQLHGQDMHNLRVQTIVESLGHNPAAFGDAFQQLEESYALAVGQGIYRPEEAKVRFNDAREKLKLTAFDNLYAANRGQAMKSMDALGLDLVQQAKAKKRYQADVQAEAAAARAARAESRELLRGREQDLVAAFTTGAKVNESQIPTEKEYVSAFGEKDGKERYQSLMQMEQLGNDLRDLQHMTPEEQAKTYANRGTEPGSKGYADNVKLQGIRQRAIDLDQNMRAADPVLYVLRADDSLRAAY